MTRAAWRTWRGVRASVVVAVAAVPSLVACAKLGGLDELTRVECYAGEPCRAVADASLADAADADANDASGARETSTRDAGYEKFVCGDRFCDRGELCCARRDGGGASCGIDCPGEDLVIFCMEDGNCAAGTVCCGQPSGLEPPPISNMTCTDQCEWPVCAMGAACDGGGAGLSCKPTLPGAPYVCQR